VQHIKVLLVKVKTLHAECFPSDHRHHCEHYYYTLYLSTCLTDKNRKHMYLVKDDATIPCSLFSHQQHSLNNAEKCELLQHRAAKVLSHQTGVQRMVSIHGVVCDSPQLCHHLTFHY
jgi:hypothetical protein